ICLDAEADPATEPDRVDPDEGHRAAEGRDPVGDAVVDLLSALPRLRDQGRIHEPVGARLRIGWSPGHVYGHARILTRNGIRGIGEIAERLRETAAAAWSSQRAAAFELTVGTRVQRSHDAHGGSLGFGTSSTVILIPTRRRRRFAAQT